MRRAKSREIYGDDVFGPNARQFSYESRRAHLALAIRRRNAGHIHPQTRHGERSPEGPRYIRGRRQEWGWGSAGRMEMDEPPPAGMIPALCFFDETSCPDAKRRAHPSMGPTIRARCSKRM